MKICKSLHIECIYYDDNIYKLMYASSYYLKNIDKDASKKYKKFIIDNIFTENELKLLSEFKA